VIGTADACKERLVAGTCGRVNVDELPRGIANELNEFGRRALVASMRLLGVFGIAGGEKRERRHKSAYQRQMQDSRF
jgi:hypothetical protein